MIQFSDKTGISTFSINNRKYIGSKYRLLHFLEKIIVSKVKNIKTFVDGFSGTGVVAHHFRKFSKKVIANDILYSNFIINKTFLCSHKKDVNLKKVIELLSVLNTLSPKKGYAFDHYGGRYFTEENAGMIDAIREEIDNLYRMNDCTEQERNLLITSLLFAADKAANTVGQYDAFLKHIGKDSYDKTGIHHIDSNVYKKIQLQLPELNLDSNNEVYNEDVNKLLEKIDGTVLYLDPPYNNRQYIDNYHVLENIARWDKPPLYGKTKKFERDELKSGFSRKNSAPSIFIDLIKKAKVNYIFFSYNNEGIIPDEIIIETLKNKGKVEIFTADYNIFGNGAGKSRMRQVKERLFFCAVDR